MVLYHRLYTENCQKRVWCLMVLTLNQGCTKPDSQLVQMTRCCTVAPNILESTVWLELHVTHLVLRIFMWLLDMFGKKNLCLQSYKVAFTVVSSRIRRNFPIVENGTSNTPHNNVTLFYTREGSANGFQHYTCLTSFSKRTFIFWRFSQSCQF